MIRRGGPSRLRWLALWGALPGLLAAGCASRLHLTTSPPGAEVVPLTDDCSAPQADRIPWVTPTPRLRVVRSTPSVDAAGATDELLRRVRCVAVRYPRHRTLVLDLYRTERRTRPWATADAGPRGREVHVLLVRDHPPVGARDPEERTGRPGRGARSRGAGAEPEAGPDPQPGDGPSSPAPGTPGEAGPAGDGASGGDGS